MSKRLGSGRPRVAHGGVAVDPARFLADLREFTDQARRGAPEAVNAGLSSMDWRIGQCIRIEVLGDHWASYGAETVARLSRHLLAGYGRGFEEKSLRRMVRFLLELDKACIRVAEYLTVLPLREVFEQRIRDAMGQSRLYIAHPKLDKA